MSSMAVGTEFDLLVSDNGTLSQGLDCAYVPLEGSALRRINLLTHLAGRHAGAQEQLPDTGRVHGKSLRREHSEKADPR